MATVKAKSSNKIYQSFNIYNKDSLLIFEGEIKELDNGFNSDNLKQQILLISYSPK